MTPFSFGKMGCYRPSAIKLEKLSHDIIEIELLEIQGWCLEAISPRCIEAIPLAMKLLGSTPSDHSWSYRPSGLEYIRSSRIIICKSLHHHLAQGMTTWSAVDRDHTDQGSLHKHEASKEKCLLWTWDVGKSLDGRLSLTRCVPEILEHLKQPPVLNEAVAQLVFLQ